MANSKAKFRVGDLIEMADHNKLQLPYKVYTVSALGSFGPTYELTKDTLGMVIKVREYDTAIPIYLILFNGEEQVYVH